MRAGLLVAVYLAVFLLMGGLVRRLSAKGGALEVTWRELSAAAIIGVAVFALSNLSFLTIRTPFSFPVRPGDLQCPHHYGPGRPSYPVRPSSSVP